jgi:CHC2 zinc finger
MHTCTLSILWTGRGRAMIPGLPDRAGELRSRLTDARDLCRALGLEEGAQPNGRGLLVKCPWHLDRDPSCSVRPGPDGTLAVKCFGCDATGDALTLIAGANGLDARRDFPRVLEIAADLAGTDLADPPPRQRPAPPPAAERGYPPADEVAALWESCSPVSTVSDVAGWLVSRGVAPAAVEGRGLARALHSKTPLPAWARFQGRDWLEIGHRCLIPTFDEHGAMRSLRARRVVDGRSPKCLPPVGFRASGLVMADTLALHLLRTGQLPEPRAEHVPLRVVICEGEPDYLAWATGIAGPNVPAVLGIVAGSWTPEIAGRIPDGSRVVIRSHPDAAGERYSAAIVATLSGRCALLRGRPEL